jgi:hypothetical protein
MICVENRWLKNVEVCICLGHAKGERLDLDVQPQSSAQARHAPKSLGRTGEHTSWGSEFLGTKQNEISFYVKNEKNIIKLKNNERSNNKYNFNIH